MANTILGYESSHTGEQIDAAVDAVLGNGTTTRPLAEQVADNTSVIETLEGTTAGHTTDITSLQETVAGQAEEIETLEETLTDIERTEISGTTPPSFEIKKDNGDTVVEVTDDGVEVTGYLKINTKNVTTEEDLASLQAAIDDELEEIQDVTESMSVEDGGVGEQDRIIISDDNDNEVASISVGSPALEEDSQLWTNDDGSDVYAKINHQGVHAKQFYKPNGDIVGEEAYTIIVDPNGRGDYTNIVDALNNAGDTAIKHVTIIINQGTYDMPPKVSGVAPYVEFNRNLTLRGVNRNKCVLRCNIGFYDYTIGTDCAPLRLCGNITVENLTVISSNVDYDNKIGTTGYITQRTNRKAAYCLHLDQARAEGDVIVVRNCTLINYQMACIGFGTRKNSTIRIEDCYAQCEQALQDSEANDYGTIWGHSGGNTSGQRLELFRNQLVHKTGNLALRYSYAEDSSTNLECSVCLIGNAVKTQNVESALQINGFPEGTVYIDPLSFGNQCSAMNI